MDAYGILSCTSQEFRSLCLGCQVTWSIASHAVQSQSWVTSHPSGARVAPCRPWEGPKHVRQPFGMSSKRIQAAFSFSASIRSSRAARKARSRSPHRHLRPHSTVYGSLGSWRAAFSVRQQLFMLPGLAKVFIHLVPASIAAASDPTAS